MSRGRVNMAEIARVSRAIADSLRCEKCGKLTTVLSRVGAGQGRSSKPMPVSEKVHCTCPGGPAGPAVPAPEKTDAHWMLSQGKV